MDEWILPRNEAHESFEIRSELPSSNLVKAVPEPI